MRGDLKIDEHHTVEDIALVMGEAFKQALHLKKGINRYGFVLPMDETLVTIAADFSGRPHLEFKADFHRDFVGDLPTELVPHFYKSFCDASGLNLNIKIEGKNQHHMIEASFKAFANCLKQAIAKSGADMPSTKGIL